MSDAERIEKLEDELAAKAKELREAEHGLDKLGISYSKTDTERNNLLDQLDAAQKRIQELEEGLAKIWWEVEDDIVESFIARLVGNELISKMRDKPQARPYENI